MKNTNLHRSGLEEHKFIPFCPRKQIHYFLQILRNLRRNISHISYQLAL